MKPDRIKVYYKFDPPSVHAYTVEVDGREMTFILNRVQYKDLHKTIQGHYIAEVRKAFKKWDIKLHGPTLSFKLKNA